MNRRSLALTALALSFPLSSFAKDPTLDGPAPTFDATDQDGNAVTSAELYKTGTTLFFFYPKAGTGG